MHFTLEKTVFLSLTLLIALTYSNVVSSKSPEAPVTEPLAFKLSEESPVSVAKAYAIFDLETGEILASKNIDVVLPIASITKLFTAAAVNENNKLDEKITITSSDVAAEGGAGRLVFGQEYLYHDLLFPLLLESSNDAAAAFERVTHGEVIIQMNNLAASVGASKTKFSDASGLSSKNVSTAGDLITLLTYLHKNEQHILDITHLRKYVGPHTGWLNNSPVLNDSYEGGKHGYTEAANRTAAVLFKETFGTEKRTLGYILLGSSDLRTDMRNMRNFVATKVTYE